MGEIAAKFVEPMMARLQSHLPEESGWEFEIKLDGIRAIGIKNGKSVRLFSRRPRELTEEFPEIANALAKLSPKQFAVDGDNLSGRNGSLTEFNSEINCRMRSAK